MNREIVSPETLAALKEQRSQLAVKHGLPSLGAKMVNQYGIEWIVGGHVYMPDLRARLKSVRRRHEDGWRAFPDPSNAGLALINSGRTRQRSFQPALEADQNLLNPLLQHLNHKFCHLLKAPLRPDSDNQTF